MENDRPRIAVTMGDPAGIGPEIIAKALAKPSVTARLRPVVIGDEKLFRKTLQDLGLSWSADVQVLDLENVDARNHRYGVVDAQYGQAAGQCIESAVALALRGDVTAVVTAPLHKESFRNAGYPYPGHTEMLAELSGARRHALMYVCEDFRVVHVTLHIPLKEVPARLSESKIHEAIDLTGEGLRAMGIESPRIGVAGINPHAGERGLFGHEEQTIIAPAIARAKREGMHVTGPYPPDTVFSMLRGKAFDAVVAMYHDQGGIPTKLLAFDWDPKLGRWSGVRGVNVTLGLPIIRTSVIHGTAFDIAGKHVADEGSLSDALDVAVTMVKARGLSRSHG